MGSHRVGHDSSDLAAAAMCVSFMAESLPCPPETITTLLIVYTPIQNVAGVKKINK